MSDSMLIERKTFIAEQGLIQASLAAFVCICIPGFLMYLTDYFEIFMNRVTESPVTIIGVLIMVGAPVLAFLVVIIASIYDYFSFTRNPNAIKSILLTQEWLIIHYNNSASDKRLNYNEISSVVFNHKQANVINPSAVKSGFKLGGASLAMASGAGSQQKLRYETDITIFDKNNQEYRITVSTKFSNSPYRNIEEIKSFFKKLRVHVIDHS